MQEQYLPTGNEWVSLPTLQARTGALESFSFLHMGYKGLIEQRGAASLPLMAPFLSLTAKGSRSGPLPGRGSPTGFPHSAESPARWRWRGCSWPRWGSVAFSTS